MAKLPCTVAITQTANPDGSVTVAGTVTDGNGSTVGTYSETVASGGSVGPVLEAIRAANRKLIGDHLTPADLPSEFTVQIGLDTSLRELDLL